MEYRYLTRQSTLPLIRQALREDGVGGDVTSRSVLAPSGRIRAHLIAKAAGILAGGPVAVWTFRAVDPSLRCVLRRQDGARLRRGQAILAVEGRARSILAAERTALNVLGHLSGVATLTQAFVHRVRSLGVNILDTRKTLPGLRALEKYAVCVGGGRSHRSGLHEAVLIKTNHLRAMERGAMGKGSGTIEKMIHTAIAQAKQRHPKRFIEIEVTTMSQFTAALAATPHAILLDNWPVSAIRKAVRLRTPTPHAPRPVPLLEVSGGVTLANVRAIAATGVERISVGRLTHSAPAVDLSLEVV